MFWYFMAQMYHRKYFKMKCIALNIEITGASDSSLGWLTPSLLMLL